MITKTGLTTKRLGPRMVLFQSEITRCPCHETTKSIKGWPNRRSAVILDSCGRPRLIQRPEVFQDSCEFILRFLPAPSIHNSTPIDPEVNI
jgi:hypothetical protein